MTHKSSFLFTALVLLSGLLVACGPKVTSTPPADQNATSTSRASTETAMPSETRAVIQASLSATLAPPTLTEPSPTTIPTLISPEPTKALIYPSIIAYIKNGAIYSWTENGGSTQLADIQDAIDLRISDDGVYIAFQRQDPNDYNIQSLWVVNTSGTPQVRELVSADELNALKPSDPNSTITGIGVMDFTWRPYTHDVAYNTLLLHEGPGVGLNHDLRLVNADTLQKTILFDTGKGGIFYYSPDGNQIALSNPESISLVNADGSNLRPNALTYPDVITYSEYAYHPHPIWASDSSSLRVTIPPHDPRAEPLPPTGLWYIPVDGSPSVLLGNIQAMPFAWPNNAFSPNLEHVAYAMPVGERSANQRALHISYPDGSDDLVYETAESLQFNSWSIDSQHFIYLINRGDKEGMYIGGLNEQPVRISSDPDVIINIHWIDNTRFAYLLSDGIQWQLRINDVNGSDLAWIDTLPDSSPVFDLLP